VIEWKQVLPYFGLGVLIGILGLLVVGPAENDRGFPTADAASPLPEPPSAKAPASLTRATQTVAGPREDVDPAALDEKLLREVPEVIYAAASTCYREEEGREEVLEVAYSVTFDGAMASLSDVKKLRSEWNAPGLESCVLAALEGLVWRDEGAPQATRDGQVSVTMLSIQTRARYLVAADELDALPAPTAVE